MTATPRRPWLVRAALLTGVALVLGACASNAPQDTLDPASPLADELANLFNGVFLAATAVFVVVEGLLLYAVIRFRRRAGDEAFPEQTHGNPKTELVLLAGPVIIMTIVAIFSLGTIFQQSDIPDDVLKVTVTGQKYWWAYSYPEQADIEGGSFITANELHIPVGQVVDLEMRSGDVIHSFWAPRLNGKRDTVPGRSTNWKIQSSEVGTFEGQCAEFCGTSHAYMRLRVIAQTQEDFDAWVASQQQDQVVPAATSDSYAGYQLFQTKNCAGCHRIDGVYEDVPVIRDSTPTAPSSPNLTHLMDRTCFAGCTRELPEDEAARRNNLEAWLRDPQGKPGSLMVIAPLSEQEIDDLYAYLVTLD